MTTRMDFESSRARFCDPDPSLRREGAEALAECGTPSAVSALVEGLGDENPGVQEAVMAALVRVGGSPVVMSLVPLLRRDVVTRNLAVEILEQIGGTALEILTPLMTHPDPNLRKFIIDTLGKLGDRRVVSALRASLRDPDPNVRSSAAEALGALRAEEAVPDLLAMLGDEEWVVFPVIEALGSLGAPDTVGPLLELLRTASDLIRYAVIEALGRFPDAGGCVAPMLLLLPSADSDCRNLLVKSIVTLAASCGMDLKATAHADTFASALSAAMESTDAEIVRAAVTGFGMIEDARGTRSILAVIERESAGSDSPAEELMEEAARALVRCADEEALVAALSSQSDLVVRIAAETLGKVGAASASQSLANLLVTHADRGVHLAAVEALGRIGDSSAIASVIAALDDETGYVRGAAAAALGKWEDPGAIAPLCRRLTVERYPDVRAMIVDALCAAPSPHVIDRFIGLLRHEHDEVRESAVHGLGKLHALSAVRDLLDAANDPAWTVRAAVAEAIGQYPVKAAYEALLLALSDDHEKVRLAAVRALADRDEPDAIEVLQVQALNDADVWVRYRVVEALGAKRIADAVPALIDMAKMAKEERTPSMLRRMAVQSLGAIGDERATDTIRTLLADRDRDVAAAAGEALNALLGAGGARGEEESDDPWK